MLSTLTRHPVSALSRRSISVQVMLLPSLGSNPDFIFQSLLHGSPEAKKEEVLQHSRLVGRGKYVHGFEGGCYNVLLPINLLTMTK